MDQQLKQIGTLSKQEARAGTVPNRLSTQTHDNILQSALQCLSVGIAIFRDKHSLLFYNEFFEFLFPTLVAELAKGCSIDSLSTANSLTVSSELAADISLLLSDGAQRKTHQLNARCWVELHCQRIGSDIRIISVFDISSQKHAEEALRRSQEAFSGVVADNTAGILVVDQNGIVLFSNSTAQSLLQRDAEDLHGEYLGLPLISDKTTEIDIVLPGGRGSGTAEMSVTDTIWAGQAAQVIMLYDVTSHKRSKQAFEYIAYHDSLTGLPNRRLLLDRLQHALSRASREHDHLAVLFLDLDGFKAVNDELGHNAGDRLLCQVAERLSRCLREMDTIARLGGDEFVVLSEHVASSDAVYELAERLRSALNQSFMISNQEVSVSTSIGVSLYPNDSDKAETLMKYADAAMYQSKAQGKNQVHFHGVRFRDPSTLAESVQVLHRAFKRNEYQLYYQPQLTAVNQQLVGLEALLRWQHPEQGLMVAAQFLPSLEEANLIHVTTDWVFHTVCRQIKQWQQLGLAVPYVAINLSPRTLMSQKALVALTNMLKNSDSVARHLLFELNGQVLLENLKTLENTLQIWASLGVRIAIDDFGATSVSISTLRQLPITQLKLSRSLLANDTGDANNEAVVEAVIALARVLQLDVVAQGVEREEQRNYLVKLNCSILQGWLTGEPMPTAMIKARLAQA